MRNAPAPVRVMLEISFTPVNPDETGFDDPFGRNEIQTSTMSLPAPKIGERIFDMAPSYEEKLNVPLRCGLVHNKSPQYLARTSMVSVVAPRNDSRPSSATI